MKKCCFIIPYFGRFPKSFMVFLKTCAYNQDFDWLIFTDDRTDYNYPSNFTVNYTTYEDLRILVDNKMGFKVSMDNPYKLCDLKPAYGYIFEEYISDYLFWGHCDIDTIIGNLNLFITDQLLSLYDKLFCLGHMTLYRNTNENNRIFMRDLHGKQLYKEVYTTPNSCWFDEEWYDENNINQIFITQGKRVLNEDQSINFDVHKRKFMRVKYVGKMEGANTHGYKTYGDENAMYIWEKGNIDKIVIKNGEIIRKPVMYMHFQHRKMIIERNVMMSDSFAIIPNGFINYRNKKLTRLSFQLRRRRTLCFDFYYRKYRKIATRIQNRFKKFLAR